MKSSEKLKEQIFKALHEKGALQSFVCRKFFFNLFQKLGFHVTGDHFYEIIPNTKHLTEIYEDKPRRLAGIHWDFPAYEEQGIALVQKYGCEFVEATRKYGFTEDNFYFRGDDALMLYLHVREHKPRRIVEIGQGFSTRIIFAALDRNAEETGQSSEFCSVDPYARIVDQEAKKASGFEVKWFRQEVQTLDTDALLCGCDFLFVDSSHAYKCGSDVEFIFHHLYEKMAPGSLIHIHDIFSPYDYPLFWMVNAKRFWNEQYILENFLRYNSDFAPYFPVYSVGRESKRFREAVRSLGLPPDFQHTGMSFYMKRVRKTT